MIPEFKTDIKKISTRIDACQVLVDFISALDRNELFEAAESYVRDKEGCSVYCFRNIDGGIMKHIITLVLRNQCEIDSVNEEAWLSNKLMDHYAFTTETIPFRTLVREILALKVRSNTIVSDLMRELQLLNGISLSKLINAMDDISGTLLTPEDAYKLSNEEIDDLIS